MLADLSNEVYFKKVFTDIEVFKAFTKDVLGIDLNITKVETEKVLLGASNIRFKMDLFAEDKTSRTIVEIQKIDYAYNYARFLHYFMGNLLDLQRDSRYYEFTKSVYLIVIITGDSLLKDAKGEKITCDGLITDLNPVALDGRPWKIYAHKMLVLNPSYLSSDTPALIRRWLDFIAASMARTNDPKIDLNHRGIARAAQLADIKSVTPEERFEAMEEQLKKQKTEMLKEEGFEKGLKKGLEKGIKEGKTARL